MPQPSLKLKSALSPTVGLYKVDKVFNVRETSSMISWRVVSSLIYHPITLKMSVSTVKMFSTIVLGILYRGTGLLIDKDNPLLALSLPRSCWAGKPNEDKFSMSKSEVRQVSTEKMSVFSVFLDELKGWSLSLQIFAERGQECLVTPQAKFSHVCWHARGTDKALFCLSVHAGVCLLFLADRQ